MAERYDLVVIGAGPGGYVAAIRAAQLGLKVACVEKRATLGGVCLNIGCIPSKALLDTSELFHLADKRFGKHGIKVGGPVAIDLKQMHARKDQIVKELTDGVRFLFKKNGITTVFGTARVASPTSVVVQDGDGAESTLETGHILLATGSLPINLPFLPFDGQTVVSSTEALSFATVPDHLVIVGGGYIGLELGSVWKRLGSKVTVVEFLPRIVPLADLEIGNVLHKSLIKQGLEFQLETKVTGAEVKNGRATVQAETKDGQKLTFDAEKVLVCVGRKAFSEGMGSTRSASNTTRGPARVGTDKAFRTSVPTISAIGDVIDGPMLAHQGRGRGDRLRRTPRRQGGAHQLRHHPQRHLYLARDGLRRDHRGTGQGAADRLQGRQIPPSSPTAAPRRWTSPRGWSRSSPTARPTACWASTSSAPAPPT